MRKIPERISSPVSYVLLCWRTVYKLPIENAEYFTILFPNGNIDRTRGIWPRLGEVIPKDYDPCFFFTIIRNFIKNEVFCDFVLFHAVKNSLSYLFGCLCVGNGNFGGIAASCDQQQDTENDSNYFLHAVLIQRLAPQTVRIFAFCGKSP